MSCGLCGNMFSKQADLTHHLHTQHTDVNLPTNNVSTAGGGEGGGNLQQNNNNKLFK